jgi:quercetin dioxygenase-like cupin family protein
MNKLTGTLYDFEKVGDELARHTHGINDVHISMVTRGKIKVVADNWEYEASAGDILDWEPGIYHAFFALEDNSRLVNLVKN